MVSLAMHVTPIPILFETPRTGGRHCIQRWRSRRRSALPRPGRPLDPLWASLDIQDPRVRHLGCVYSGLSLDQGETGEEECGFY